MEKPKSAKRRGFITFQQSKGRQPLSREEYTYWASFLPKVLKISTEFEYNLPSPQVTLKKDLSQQPCINLAKGCASLGCVHLEECITSPHPALCNTKKTGRFLGDEFDCPAKNDADTEACAKCPGWVLNCQKTSCAMFTPFCSVCPSFDRGKGAPENADIRMDAEGIRNEMTRLLQPTGSVSSVGQFGVLEVKRDNSLTYDGGIEIPTVGRRFHWNSFYKMCKDILDPLMERGASVDERCGQHFHILAGYFNNKGSYGIISELEKPVPEIIMANLHQLHRRYELALFWIMSAGNSMESLTRWARFRQRIFPFSALRTKMAAVTQELAEKIICMNSSPKDGKYASIAYYLSTFDAGGDISTFHFENRIADGAQSPAVITAWAALCFAFVMKAVRCSQYGIVEVGNREFIQKTLEIQPKLIDGGLRGWDGSRKADTSGLTESDMDFLVSLSKEMVMFMKSELTDMGPAYTVLQSLAESPCSLHLSAGLDWYQIEKLLLPQNEDPSADDLASGIQELIDLSGITDCQSLEEWVDEVSAHLGASSPEIATMVHDMINRGLCRWSNPIGTVIAT